MPGGILFGSDWNRLFESVRRVVDRSQGHHINFVEIGVLTGATGRDLIGEVYRRQGEINNLPAFFTWYGVDAFCNNPSIPPPYAFVRGLSHEVVGQLPSKLHWVFVDGCHCEVCVRRDIECYAPRIVLGGELLFHDASPLEQEACPGSAWAGPHHNQEEANKGTQVRKALDGNSILAENFRLIQQAPQEQRQGGVEVYEKIGGGR